MHSSWGRVLHGWAGLAPPLQEDYVHLLEQLCVAYHRRRKAQSRKAGAWQFNDAVKEEIASIVKAVMSKCTIYDTKLDSELGLTETS